jgi:hypothetical protein
MSELPLMRKNEKLEIAWPFNKYEILVPEIIESDLFIILYIKILILTTKSSGKEIRMKEFSQNDIDRVDDFLKNNFSSIIDDKMLDMIKSNSSRYLVLSQANSGTIFELTDSAKKVLNNEATYSETIRNYFIYQDALSGEVVYYFGNELNEKFEYERDRLSPIIKERPKPYYVLKKYERYISRSRFSEMKTQIDEDQLADERTVLDYDTEYDIDDDSFYEHPVKEDVNIDNNEKPNTSLRYKDEGTLVYFDIDIEVIDNRMVVTSPFSEWADNEFPEMIARAKNSGRCDDLANKLKTLHLDEPVLSNLLSKDIQDSEFSSQLKYFKRIYEIAEEFCDKKRLRYYMIRIEQRFSARTMEFFQEIGNFLEFLIKPYIDRGNRGLIYEFYENDLQLRENQLNIDLGKMRNRELYSDWKKNREKFKADLASVIISWDFCFFEEKFDTDLINRIMHVYSIRNQINHDSKHVKPEVNDIYIEYIYQFVVFMKMISRGKKDVQK